MSKEIVLAKNPTTLSGFLENCKGQLAKALPPGMLTPERLMRCVVTECGRNPALFDCTAISIAGCMIQAAQLGLEIGGPLGQVYMVPYKVGGVPTANFQIGYKGLIALAGRSARAVLSAQVVREKDRFEMELGSSPFVRHVPAFGERGGKIGVYSVIRFPDRPFDLEWMSQEELVAHRTKYSKQSGSSSPWTTAEDQMQTKTVMRRIAKRCPMSVELQRAATLDEYADEGLPQDLEDLVEGEMEGRKTPTKSKTQEVADRLKGQADGKPGEMFPESDTGSMDALRS